MTYSAADIERMRQAVRRAKISGDTGTVLGCLGEPALTQWVEEHVRTYIAAGCTPDDVEATEKMKERRQ